MVQLKQKRRICLFFSVVILLSGCQLDSKKKSNDAKKIIYRDTFTEDEKMNGTAKFDLTENVNVDAKITPLDKYKNGLEKYYTKYYIETEGIKAKKMFNNKPILYGKSLSKAMEMLSGRIGGIFGRKKPIVGTSNKTSFHVDSDFKGKNSLPYIFHANWSAEDEFLGNGDQLYAPTMTIGLQNGINKVLDSQIDYHIGRYIWNPEDFELAFLDNRDKTGEELKNFLEELLGRKLNDTWDWIPVTQKSVDLVNRISGDESVLKNIKVGQEDEYCTYRYYYDVKGFPFEDLSLNYRLKEGETASEIAALSGNSVLMGLSDHEILCRISKNGIINLWTSNIRMEGATYKKAGSVAKPETILQKVKKYYDKQILDKQITITELEIIYTGYFTDGSEGEIKPTVAPFWRVRAYGDKIGYKYFVYDAFTGEAVIEGGTN